MQLQNKTLLHQQFESTFFQLIINHQEIVNGIDIGKWVEVNYGENNKTRAYESLGISKKNNFITIAKARDCFELFYQEFKSSIKEENFDNISIVNEKYLAYFNQKQSDLGHYFRHLYHILKFIENSKYVSDEEKFTYTSILRALLSSFELTMIFYNCLSIYGNSHFKPLVEKYAFLKNLDSELLISKNHMKEYQNIAFESSDVRNKRISSKEPGL